MNPYELRHNQKYKIEIQHTERYKNSFIMHSLVHYYYVVLTLN